MHFSPTSKLGYCPLTVLLSDVTHENQLDLLLSHYFQYSLLRNYRLAS